MNNDYVITIARQYGCGGGTIGKMLADRQKIAYYDTEIIKMAAKQNGVDEMFYKEFDEKSSSKFASMLAFNASGGGYFMPMYNDLLINDKVFYTQANIIKNVAVKPCVIVGRCADYILKDKPNLVKVFLHANMETRKERIVNKYGVEDKNIEKLIAKADKRRSTYYNTYSDLVWGDVKNYDITIDTSRLKMEAVVEIIEAYINNLSTKD